MDLSSISWLGVGVGLVEPGLVELTLAWEGWDLSSFSWLGVGLGLGLGLGVGVGVRVGTGAASPGRRHDPRPSPG